MEVYVRERERKKAIIVDNTADLLTPWPNSMIYVPYIQISGCCVATKKMIGFFYIALRGR